MGVVGKGGALSINKIASSITIVHIDGGSGAETVQVTANIGCSGLSSQHFTGVASITVDGDTQVDSVTLVAIYASVVISTVIQQMLVSH